MTPISSLSASYISRQTLHSTLHHYLPSVVVPLWKSSSSGDAQHHTKYCILGNSPHIFCCSTLKGNSHQIRHYASINNAESHNVTPQFIEREFFSPDSKNKKLIKAVRDDAHHFKKGKLSLLSYARLVDMTDFIQKHRTETLGASQAASKRGAPGRTASADSNEKLKVNEYKSLLMPGVNAFLKTAGITKFTDIQAKSLSCTLKSLRPSRKGDLTKQPDSVLLASQTGTGKTLAYLLPIVHNIKYDEKHLAQGIHAFRPRALILVPSRQLASQVHRVAKSIAHQAKFRAALFRSDFKTKRMRLDAEDADIVITTPGVWRHMINKELAGYSDLQYVVVDEADSMLDEKSFGKEVSDILSAAQKKNADVQYYFAMATVNHSILDWTSTFARQARVLASESVHRHVPTVRQSFIDCSQLDKLKEVLLPLVKQEQDPTIIFCNTVDSARAVNLYLQENDIDTSNFHAEIYPKEQHEEFERFRKGIVQFLVSTDIASRGLDLTSVKHVINFDFPKNHVDYIHRIGRTGRMGAKGQVTSLLKKRDKGLAESIKRAILAEQRIDTITERHVEKKDFMKYNNDGRRMGRTDMRSGSIRRGSKPSSRIGKNPALPPSPEGW